MRRVIFHDGGPRVAAAAAHLAEDYDVRPLAGEPLNALILVGAGSGVRPNGTTRLIGLVEPGDAGPWPLTWYAVLPVEAPPAMLRRAVGNAFADLEAEADLERLERDLAELNAIGIRLSSEANPRFLLETILSKARDITTSDAGSLYIVDPTGADGAHLRFALAQNDSVNVPFRAATLPLTAESVAGHVALTGRIVNVADAYAPPPDSPFAINRWFDDQARYRTKSMLVVPMRTPQGDTIGALQLINCKGEWRGPLGDPQDVERHVRPYGPRHEKLASSLASQAAVAIHNRRLYLSIRDLFEGFVTASVTAIEARDPTTSGHSFRVAELTVGLAEVVDRCDSGPYADLRFGADEIMEIRYASLLHDFGKVGVREHVLVKSKKLYPAELDRIRHRVELLKRELALRTARAKLDAAVGGERDYAAVAARLDAELATALADLDRHLDLIVVANEPTVQTRELSDDIAAIAAKVWHDADGAPRAILMPAEARVLAIPRGSLTDDERRDIQDHVVHTFEFLSRIPWTRELRRVPDIAGAHHEKLNGTGYPNAVRAGQIPVQSRMMAIADIYDALTASDRPYKKAVRSEEALGILEAERRAGALDGTLLDLFIAARVFDRVTRSS